MRSFKFIKIYLNNKGLEEPLTSC